MSYTYQNSWRLSLVKLKRFYDNSNATDAHTHTHLYNAKWVVYLLFSLSYILILFLSLQAILFYTPRWLWKSWEGGKIHALIMDLDIGICSEAEKKQKKKLLLDYLWENLR